MSKGSVRSWCRLTRMLLFAGMIGVGLVYLFSYSHFVKRLTLVEYPNLNTFFRTGNTSHEGIKSGPFIDPVLLFKSQKYEQKKEILWFNPAFWINSRNEALQPDRCQSSNCIVHTNRRRLNQSAAVIFTISESDKMASPPVSAAQRDPDQPWIFFSLEAPHYIQDVNLIPDWHRNAFNWSWSYRRDADIFQPYGALFTNKNPPAKNYTDIFRKKTKFAAWMVGHCTTHAKREQYIAELQKYIPVDVYGRCSGRKVDDYKTLLKDYKFYLGFENDLCPWYVTEKFFWYRDLDLIPVVRGGLDYDTLLPNDTFINTAHFKTIKSLADFLLKTGSSEQDYTAFLHRKDQYVSLNQTSLYNDAVCQVCEKLNALDANRKTYPSVVDWVSPKACSVPRDIPRDATAIGRSVFHRSLSKN